MSFIDSYKYKILGNIIGIPVYYPLENIKDPDGYDFSRSATKESDVILGGGGGELLGWVIGINSAVKRYFDTEYSNDILDRISYDEYDEYIESLADEDFTAALWDGDTWYDIVSSALQNGYSQEDDYPSPIETWLKCRVGELIVKEHPNLYVPLDSADQEMFEKLSNIVRSL